MFGFMNGQLSVLRNVIDGLRPEMPPQEINERKEQMLALVDHVLGTPSTNDVHHDKLSPREREVMTMLLTGRRLKEIGAELNISVKTVTTHRARLLRKLRLEDNLGLYRYAVRNGLISV